MQIVSEEDNLHEVSYPIFLKKNTKNSISLSSAEFAHSIYSVITCVCVVVVFFFFFFFQYCKTQGIPLNLSGSESLKRQSCLGLVCFVRNSPVIIMKIQ